MISLVLLVLLLPSSNGYLTWFKHKTQFVANTNPPFRLNIPVRQTISLQCIGTYVTPVQPAVAGTDIEQYYAKELDPNIELVDVGKSFPVQPQLITFDAIDLLIRPSTGMGKWLREIINYTTENSVRFPTSALFSQSFNIQYERM